MRKGRSDLIQFSIISAAVKNPGQFHHLGLFIDRVDDAVFPLCHPKTGEATVSEMRELFRIWRTWRAAETQNLEKDLAETFGIAVTKIFERREDGL
jgi:hypothetical protein